LKKPMNVIEAPEYPDIRKAPPRFVWTKKHWTVDTGRTMAEIEHIPQLQEAAILYQSYDYGSQHLYGKRPTYTAFVNKEFRPPLIEMEDIMPLSRIPRPVVVPRINPGGAHASGNSTFAEQNINLPGVEKYLTDRVKVGELRPTFFCPIDMPQDNSVLPDLEVKMPPISGMAGYKFPSAIDSRSQSLQQSSDMKLDYKKFNPSVATSITPVKLDARDGRQDSIKLDYNTPQVSATAGTRGMSIEGFTPVDLSLDYHTPQVSATAGYNSRPGTGVTFIPENIDELDYKQPMVSGFAGYNTPGTISSIESTTPVDIHLEKKIEGSTPSSASRNYINIWNPDQTQIDNDKITEERRKISYVVPHSNPYGVDSMPQSSQQPHFRSKATSLNYAPQITQSYIPRQGISTPQVKVKSKRGI